MWRRSFSRPGAGGRPSASHFSRAWPPFQARVVKPNISTLTPQRSSVRARMSAEIGVAEFGVALDLVGQGMGGIDDDPRQPRGVEKTFLLVEIP